MNKKLTDAEIDLSTVRDQYVVKRNKLNRLISDREALVIEAVLAQHETDAEKHRQEIRQLRRLRLDTEAEINAIVIELNRLAAERKSK